MVKQGQFLSISGLGHRIGVHYDVKEDGDVDGDDPWYYFAYDAPGTWRIVATFRDDDPPDEPKEIFVYHAAGLGGLGGFGGSSYIDSVILRDRDANTDWDAASDGVLEERIYYCQNWRHDVVALITEAGGQVQQIRYSAYGIPIGLPAGDVNSRGDVSSTDDSIIAGWVNTTQYDVRGDLNLDGVVTNADRTLLQANLGVTLGWGVMSLAVDHAGATGGGGNRKGYAGYEGDFSRGGFWHVRHRVLDSELGRSISRPRTTTCASLNFYALPSSQESCQQYLERCLKNPLVKYYLDKIKGCWSEIAPGAPPLPIGCEPCGPGADFCGLFVPIVIDPATGKPPPGWPKTGNLFLCQEWDDCVDDVVECGTLLHEIMHAYQWCLYNKKFGRKASDKWQDPVNCIYQEFYAYDIEGGCGLGVHADTCCDLICGSCADFWPSFDECKAKCLELHPSLGCYPGEPWQL